MISITQESDVNINSGLQALYFYSDWLLFHKKMLVMIGKVEDKYKNITFTSINSDNFKSLCTRFTVDSIPAIIVFKDGVEIKRINGMLLTSAMNSAFADICKE